ncbi:hypothetical protein SteCoe_23685 [Stentor coeruleus]|uniref:DNA topoisomerase 2 n=1 Tax=Stentor coeruleus TaxID=5963 RepID=A0A1R2BJB6_9CILI|nr:hypothetical protein SteCoe_23685 [Stentor coeruleus]
MKSKKDETSESGGSTIEQIYQKKTPLEHILLRPDTYVGSIEQQDSKLWVWDTAKSKMAFRQVQYVPGLYKIFDEILVNASDNFQRDNTMNKIMVTIDHQNSMIKVWNNGKGIPVVIHQEYNIYVPELIFGQLLTSSNYDDSKKKVTGGRNGYGAKLTNVFSKKFILETANSESMKKFTMEWSKNMSIHGDAKVEKLSKKEDYTCITFYPDLERFGMTILDKDIVDLMTKRVYDLAGITDQKVKVFLNDKEIKLKNFQEYVELYLTDSSLPKIFEVVNDRWEVGVSISDGVFQQVSFVNGICTTKGGTHVNHVADQIIQSISELVQKKFKKIEVKNAQIKQHLWIFVNCLVENPCFDSQTKDTMTLKPSAFGSKCEISSKMMKEILKCGVIDHVMAYAKAKTEAQLGKKVRQKKNEKIFMNKLEDANDAGSRNGYNCTLILTEGDSAKSLAMAGIEVIGRDTFGVFPLKGKLLNVREASHSQLMNNEEVQNIMKIVGLEPKKEYNSLTELRYGCIMIMADQDLDGSHIKGLVINFVHFFWPGLLKKQGFLKEFITPIVKATKNHDVISFFTIPEYEAWIKADNRSTWKIKYYKGLGTSTSKEAQEYFSNLDRHRIEFIWRDDVLDEDAIDLAFNKKRADDRKQWLANLNPDTFLDMNQHGIEYNEFIHKELILFSNYDNIRSIPSIMDGLKPGQRKIIFSCFKRKLKGEIKVAQLSGYVAEHSAYHHGEASLASTIVGLAQNYVGSNNINLLLPLGQFGTRNMGGKDMASARYIFTNLSPLTRKLFIQEDDYLFTYQTEDGQKIEPVYYAPIIPIVLINGSDGIGTGWSTSVPQYNPYDLIDAYRKRIQNKSFDEFDIKPWYKGFTGTIDWIDRSGGGYEITGVLTRLEDDWLQISELPIRKWTSEYKKFLEEFMKEDEPFITELKEYHTENRVDFHIRVPGVDKYSDGMLKKKFKLVTTISINNLVLFNKDRKIVKYTNVSEIMEEHYLVREDFYKKRKEFMIAKLTRECEILANKVRFILAVVENELVINKKQKMILVKELQLKKFATKKQLDMIFIEPVILSDENNKDQEQEIEPETETNATVSAKEYDYLLNMPLWSLTYEKVEALKKEHKEKSEELEKLRKISIYDMWNKDLEELENAISQVWESEEEDRKNRPKAKTNKNKMVKPKKRNMKKKENKEIVENDKKAKQKKNTVKTNFDDDFKQDMEKVLGKTKSTPLEERNESNDASLVNNFKNVPKKMKQPGLKMRKIKKNASGESDEDSSFGIFD